MLGQLFLKVFLAQFLIQDRLTVVDPRPPESNPLLQIFMICKNEN